MIILVCCSAGIFKEVLVPLWSYLMSGLHGYEKRGKIIYLSPLLFSDIYAYSNCFDITLSLSGEHKETALPFSRLTIHSVSLTEYISNCVLYICFATVFFFFLQSFCCYDIFLLFYFQASVPYSYCAVFGVYCLLIFFWCNFQMRISERN